ncbi:hypothetical protein CDD83_9229 [Cordyceps sp. RAO-2017]|nr:hypothetical protein CDD83_9229 [Cordyceps sp. RAO-2017]
MLPTVYGRSGPGALLFLLPVCQTTLRWAGHRRRPQRSQSPSSIKSAPDRPTHPSQSTPSHPNTTPHSSNWHAADVKTSSATARTTAHVSALRATGDKSSRQGQWTRRRGGCNEKQSSARSRPGCPPAQLSRRRHRSMGKTSSVDTTRPPGTFPRPVPVVHRSLSPRAIRSHPTAKAAGLASPCVALAGRGATAESRAGRGATAELRRQARARNPESHFAKARNKGIRQGIRKPSPPRA